MTVELPQKPDWLKRVTIVGVGLLGGSVGKSLRRSQVHVTGCARRDETCSIAVASGAADECVQDLPRACNESDVIVIASPVHRIAELTAQAFQYAPEHAVITDVGSTKSRLVDQIKSLCPEQVHRFVAAHPIAGSEKTGVENATATLMDGKPVIMTPSEDTDSQSVQRCREFWMQAGSNVVSMTPRQHDERLAAISHVPHLVSSLLASLIDDETAPLVGSGWKDMTRVAAGDPKMWTAICDHNRDSILNQLDRFSSELQGLRDRLEKGNCDEIQQWLSDAKQKKDAT